MGEDFCCKLQHYAPCCNAMSHTQIRLREESVLGVIMLAFSEKRSVSEVANDLIADGLAFRKSQRTANSPVSIYVLRCPETNQIRYVGRTKNERIRLATHIKQPHGTRLKEWVTGLVAKKLRPSMEVVEVTTHKDACSKESHWIKKLQREGCDLLNHMLM